MRGIVLQFGTARRQSRHWAMQNLPYDGHTHTNRSDGRDAPVDNLRAAEAAGLECVAFTDHCYPNTSNEELNARRKLAKELDKQSPVKVVFGVEGVILDSEGTVSVGAEAARGAQLVLAEIGALTRGVAVDPPASPRRFEEIVLATYANAARNPVVDVLAHPFNLGRFPAVLTPDQFSREGLRRLAQVLVDCNVALELMNQAYWWYPQMSVAEFTREYTDLLRVFSRAGVKFTVGSDAHSSGAVGNLRYCIRLMREAGIERSQLVDLGRMVAARQRG